VIELLQCLPVTFRHPGSWKNKTRAFVVRNHNGQQLAYVYFEDEPGGDQRPCLAASAVSNGVSLVGVNRPVRDYLVRALQRRRSSLTAELRC
jgi:hypothetical protein